MDYIYIGDIVNTHGIKGELRILSDFKYKDKVFVHDFCLYVGRNKELLTIDTYRTHKEYDMVKFYEVEDINDAIAYKGDKVYINKNDIKIDGYFNEDLIGLDVYGNDILLGQVEKIITNNSQELLVIKNNDNKHLIPYVKEFIKKIDLDKKRIDINLIEGLIDEN